MSRGGLHELLDGLIVVIAAGAVALVVFTLPTATYGNLSPFALLQGVYPVIDVCVLFVILLLSWTSANRVTSYWFLTGATLATLTGDLGYAYIGTQGHTGRDAAAGPAVRVRVRLPRRRRPAPVHGLADRDAGTPGSGLVARRA